jgi:hypothetical protein
MTWTISNVQLDDPGNGTTPIHVTFTGAIAAGDTLVAYFGSTGNNAGPPSLGTLQDTAGNNWQIADGPRTSGDNLCTTWLAYATGVNASLANANVLTWTPTGVNTSSVFLAACEAHSSVAQPAFDVANGTTGNNAAPTVTVTAGTSTGLQIGCTATNVFDGTPTVGTSGYASQASAGSAGALLASLVASSTAATTAGFALSGTEQWTAQILVLKNSAATPPIASTGPFADSIFFGQG